MGEKKEESEDEDSVDGAFDLFGGRVLQKLPEKLVVNDGRDFKIETVDYDDVENYCVNLYQFDLNDDDRAGILEDKEKLKEMLADPSAFTSVAAAGGAAAAGGGGAAAAAPEPEPEPESEEEEDTGSMFDRILATSQEQNELFKLIIAAF